MAYKHFENGVFESMGRAVDESVEMAAALRDGRLTRRQFDTWYARRRAQSRGLIIGLRQRTTRILEPVSTVIEQGRHAISVAARRSATRRVSVRRSSRRRVSARRG
jgi:hypothetical protein